MARIKPLDEKTIPEGSRETWAAMHKKFGKVPNLFATFAHSPAAFSGYIAFLSALDRGKLSGREIELINLHVSELNGCAYCVSAHTFLADRIGLSPDEALAARAGSAANRRDQAILALARRITRTGGAGAGGELARAREAGLSDAEVLEVIAHAASKLFTNAIGILAQTEIDFPKAPRLPEP